MRNCIKDMFFLCAAFGLLFFTLTTLGISIGVWAIFLLRLYGVM